VGGCYWDPRCFSCGRRLTQQLRPLLRWRAGEDFSFIGKAVPACFVFLGIRNETLGTVHGLHTPKFKVDESVLKTGAALHASLAIEFLVRAIGYRWPFLKFRIGYWVHLAAMHRPWASRAQEVVESRVGSRAPSRRVGRHRPFMAAREMTNAQRSPR
jgi:hypothetical protein